MAPLAMALFVLLFAFGEKYFGWPHADGKIQLALAASFVFGVVAAFRMRD